MKDSYTIPMDDPVVKEILRDLEQTITDKAREALRRSLRLRHLRTFWDREVGALPVVGESWCKWISERPKAAGKAIRLLSDAGVLGTQWPSDAQQVVFEAKGWS